ncbi:MAG: hypothetical protein AB7Q27_06675 [Acidimicrobiia bacterium]
MPSPRSCLVLGGRDALAKLEAPIATALEAAGLRRAVLDDLSEFEDVLRRVDIVLADVSRVSPAVSFELGAASAVGVKAVYTARAGSRVSPVFEPVLFYNEDDTSALRLGFLLARALEDTLNGRTVDVEVDADESSHPYRPGDRFLGVTVRVDPSGYVLVAQVGRRPALLPFSLMIDSDLVNRGERRVRAGDLLLVDVEEVEGDRVTLREAEGPLPARLPVDIRQAQAIMRASSLIGSVVDSNGNRTTTERAPMQQLVFEWVTIHPSGTKRLRHSRNLLSHGEQLDARDLAEAAEIATELLEVAFRTEPGDTSAGAAFLESTHRIEQTLEMLLRTAGVGVPARSHGLRALGNIGERSGVVPAEVRDILSALGRLRNEMVHGSTHDFDRSRIELGLVMANSMDEFLWERHRTLDEQRRTMS